jgi:hypothetical protein
MGNFGIELDDMLLKRCVNVPVFSLHGIFHKEVNVINLSREIIGF